MWGAGNEGCCGWAPAAARHDTQALLKKRRRRARTWHHSQHVAAAAPPNMWAKKEAFLKYEPVVGGGQSAEGQGSGRSGCGGSAAAGCGSGAGQADPARTLIAVQNNRLACRCRAPRTPASRREQFSSAMLRGGDLHRQHSGDGSAQPRGKQSGSTGAAGETPRQEALACEAATSHARANTLAESDLRLMVRANSDGGRAEAGCRMGEGR